MVARGNFCTVGNTGEKHAWSISGAYIILNIVILMIKELCIDLINNFKDMRDGAVVSMGIAIIQSL